MTDLQIHTYGPAWAVTEGRTFIAFAVSQANAEDLVRRLEAHPQDQWHRLVPCPFTPCIVTSVRKYDSEGAVVLGGADSAGLPVAMPLSAAEWTAFEAKHPGHGLPFHARVDPGRGKLELLWSVQAPSPQPKGDAHGQEA